MIELRWEERQIDTVFVTINGSRPAKGVKAFLQYRVLENVVKLGGGAYLTQEWSEWKDVPTKQFVLMCGDAGGMAHG